MGFELGPKVLRRAPRGWLPARAFPEKHSVTSHHYGSDGVPEIEMSMALRVTWRVEVAGREPYELNEERSVPNWLDAGGLVGHGNRWYKVRVRPQYGLMPDVGVPCRVDPSDPSAIWIDWDAAFKEHGPAWDREARVRREASRREGGIDAALSRLGNPLVGKLRPDDEPYVERELERRGQRRLIVHAQYDPANPTPAGESAELQRRLDDLTRVVRDGRKTTGVVVSRVESGRTFGNVPVVDLVFEIEGRHVAFEHMFGPRHAKHYVVGKEVEVWVDQADPDHIRPGR